MFHRAELRMLALTFALFLAGIGWKVAHASASLPPLVLQGEVVSWQDSAPAPERSETISKASSMESPRAPSSKTVAVPARINPNTATREQLIALPGVGPALAARILEARVKSPFRSLADLDRVKGIGPAKLETLRSHLTF